MIFLVLIYLVTVLVATDAILVLDPLIPLTRLLVAGLLWPFVVLAYLYLGIKAAYERIFHSP